MNDLLKKYQIHCWLAGYLIGISVFSYFVLLPWLAKIRQESDKIQERVIDNEINKNRIDKIPQMEEAFNEIKNNGLALEVILSPGQEVSFIQILESIARETGNKITLKISDVKKGIPPKPAPPAAGGAAPIAKPNQKNSSNIVLPNPTTNQPPKEKNIEESISYQDYLPIQVTLEGDYKGLVRFIEKIENMNYYTNIISLSIEKKAELYEEEVAVAEIITPEAGDIFSVERVENSPSSKKKDLKEREVLTSVINIAVYLKI